ncbi:MAG: four-carbon acid sugar kinase family protein [Phycisphaerales bacterium]|nr:four-carbon acid sugar kinase family protein [Phycisphaerales bacterium]
MRILVLADDFSGAAETAGIGWRFGLPVRLLRQPPKDVVFAGMTVVDTDSRGLAPSAAAERVRTYLRSTPRGSFDLVYKKIDSVLRGPVMAEVDAVARALKFTSALLLPQNPSRGRTIEGGVYRIDGIPLAETEFARDPEYPARSSEVCELLGPARLPVTVANAATVDQVRAWAGAIDPTTLPVGGADFLRSILQLRGLHEHSERHIPALQRPALIACGSASARAAESAARARSIGLAIFPMPATDADRDPWIAAVARALRDHGRAMMTIHRPIDPAPDAPRRLTEQFTAAVRDVAILADPATLLVAGGATAAGVCDCLRMSSFEVTAELEAGVVALRAVTDNPDEPAVAGAESSPIIVVKPGSYPWPEEVWKLLAS